MSSYPDISRKDWKARPAVVVAAGPSLTREDVEIVRASREADRIRVISVSNAWKLCSPWADAYFAGDRRYWIEYLAAMLRFGVPRDRLVTCCNVTAKKEAIQFVRAANQPGLGTFVLHTGGNSGWMGLNLAYLYGARRIYLLGFDMMLGPAAEKHFDGAHTGRCDVALNFAEWIHRIRKAKPDLDRLGCQVMNLSRRTALDCFPRSTVEAELLPGGR